MHVIVGAGAVGSTTARQLAEAGEQVRLITRSGSGPVHPNIERVAADAGDATVLTRLSKGAVAIYNCANPPYHTWPTDWPPMADAMLAAAGASGAPLAITGNLYVYGPVDRPMTEDMPLAAPTVKGRVRVKMWEDAVAAYRSGRISGVTEVRGSDYLSPRYSIIEMAMPGLRANKTVWLPGPLDHPHTFTYTGDMGAALIALARDPRAWGQAWHVPSPAPMTMRQVVAKVAEVGGYPLPRLRSYPKAAVRAAGLFDRRTREFVEMSYQWERPFVLDTTLAESTFGLSATDVDEAVRASIPSPEPVAA
ncbi:NAD-dependent epimerase [Asanoa ishikariensis]|uniref:Nucleoside-diphosphate-sugar epimerase n=1 Tax=Asanoa ishikariensis TaxID=137265 RepID=A0A1H3LLF4_9ACTN|nr:2-dehydropantoate 2-reductase N-terminal domain-containing protein [Asanoa ishikariensis]GIF65545.1 NAD-dependent epimerase [Asanoa ishikariensis]SDY64969.1 Nucleoside-diphosphate-sugar epimerase [Asanoa ishikariensis]